MSEGNGDWEEKWWWRGVNLGGAQKEEHPSGSLLLSLSQLKLTALRQTHRERPAAHVIQQWL